MKLIINLIFDVSVEHFLQCKHLNKIPPKIKILDFKLWALDANLPPKNLKIYHKTYFINLRHNFYTVRGILYNVNFKLLFKMIS